MTTSKFLPVLGLAVMAAMLAGCGVSRTVAPPLQGPSTLALSLTLAASPDALSMDGASQSRITIDARDANAQLIPNQQVRAEILAFDPKAGGYVPDDFGSINLRTVSTGSNGEAVIVYTAPSAVPGAPIPTQPVRVVINPASGTEATDANFGFDTSRFVAIRLLPPGVITAGGPTPKFTFTPQIPAAFTDVLFDASTTTASLGTSIVSYSWSFGDGSSAAGVQVHHQFGASLTFLVTLTVTDSNGISASLTQGVVVSPGNPPRAVMTFSPASPGLNQTINFNGGLSTPGAGHSIVRWDWNFGDGTTLSGVTVSKSYSVAGSYNVVLTVTDEAGQTGLTVTPVQVGSPTPPTASFTFGPPAPRAGITSVLFDGNGSKNGLGTSSGLTYTWNFGDGTISATTASPTINHTYAAVGGYSATLRVNDTATNLSNTSTAQTVTVGP